MSEWLKIVKKHAKLNPGKSLKEYLPVAQAEYKKLKASGKVTLTSAVKTTKKVGKKMMKKFKKQHTKKMKKHSKGKKQRGGARDNDETDITTNDVDVDVDVDEEVVDMPTGSPTLVRQNATVVEETGKPEEEPEISLEDEDQTGGKSPNYGATIFMKGRTRAGGKGRKGRKGGKISNVDVAVSNTLAAVPLAMRAQSRSSAKVGGKKKINNKSIKNKKLRGDITTTNLA